MVEAPRGVGVNIGVGVGVTVAAGVGAAVGVAGSAAGVSVAVAVDGAPPVWGGTGAGAVPGVTVALAEGPFGATVLVGAVLAGVVLVDVVRTPGAVAAKSASPASAAQPARRKSATSS